MGDYRVCRRPDPTLAVLLSLSLLSACGDDGARVGVDPTGATLRGTVTSFETQSGSTAIRVAAGPAATSGTGGVTVVCGERSTQTDAGGAFMLTNLPVGDHVVTFSRDGAAGLYSLDGITHGETFVLNDIQYSNGQVSTAHTGRWVGTGGSSGPSSAGQIGLTLIIRENGNAISGSATVEGPDGSRWSMSGTENGTSVEGVFALVSSNSSCAAGASFDGTFAGDTLSGTFVEVNPPAGCGSPESGTFRVVRQ